MVSYILLSNIINSIYQVFLSYTNNLKLNWEKDKYLTHMTKNDTDSNYVITAKTWIWFLYFMVYPPFMGYLMPKPLKTWNKKGLFELAKANIIKSQ